MLSALSLMRRCLGDLARDTGVDSLTRRHANQAEQLFAQRDPFAKSDAQGPPPSLTWRLAEHPCPLIRNLIIMPCWASIPGSATLSCAGSGAASHAAGTRTMPAMPLQPLSKISPPHMKFCPTPSPAPHMIGGEAFRQASYPIRPPPQLRAVKLPAWPSVDCAAR